MTVHMIRVCAAKPADLSVDEIDELVQKWVARYSAWDEDLEAHTITEVIHPDEGVDPYVAGNFRFLDSDDHLSLLDDAELTLQGAVDWYRLGYHHCGHDDDSGGCAGDRQRDYGSIPDTVPVFV